MVGRLLSFWDGIFSGAMLNLQGVCVQVGMVGTWVLYPHHPPLLDPFGVILITVDGTPCTLAVENPVNNGTNYRSLNRLVSRISETSTTYQNGAPLDVFQSTLTVAILRATRNT